ncbi:inositol phosphorylceramide synthase [Cohnella endophytica]|uniref:Inositol phosphorylceramide synthase n=1 Tax=Cohnella endophytica TaxID=2419778 RepID=A0A494Y1F7_9BACL|nr:phosphatase PAP2 family protein [Cohnella endophytica]RKP54267.1 inositol phosphorylceramide synthase [Cohnella endophytica]
MVLFHGMASVSISTVIMIGILLSFGTGRQPFAAVWSFVKSLVVSRKYLFFFIAVLTIILLNKNELQLEDWINVTYDLTPYLSGWEGTWPAWLQSTFHSDILTVVCGIFYLILFQSVTIASIGIYTHHNNMKLYYAVCIALLLNYLVAVPFYLFVPVNEVWFVHPQVKFLMLDVFPTFEQEYRALSGINNCFPSLHTSISVTLALIAGKSGIRRWAVFSWINAGVIVFSIFYLGIHWFTDMVAGVLLACFASYVGLKLGDWAAHVKREGTLEHENTKVLARSAHSPAE